MLIHQRRLKKLRRRLAEPAERRRGADELLMALGAVNEGRRCAWHLVCVREPVPARRSPQHLQYSCNPQNQQLKSLSPRKSGQPSHLFSARRCCRQGSPTTRAPSDMLRTLC